jgi:gamma-glutamyltranspeptidase/glutathione hydrolase
VIAPNKRPFHTIIPAMLTDGDKLTGVFGVMGGQYQAVGQMGFLINHLDRGMTPQQALDAPRSFAIDGELQCEPLIHAAVAADLSARGHIIQLANSPIGGGQAIIRDPATGLLMAGSDPRKDGFAAGY